MKKVDSTLKSSTACLCAVAHPGAGNRSSETVLQKSKILVLEIHMRYTELQNPL